MIIQSGGNYSLSSQLCYALSEISRHDCCILGQQTLVGLHAMEFLMKQTKMYVCTLKNIYSSRCSHIAVQVED